MPDTTTARIGLRDDGLLVVRVRESVQQSLADATENLALAIAETGGRRRPLLIDIRKAQPLEAEVRHHYTGQRLVEGFTALALLVEVSAFGRTMGNVYLRVARPGIPTRLFTDEDSAVRWLEGYRS